MIFVIDLVFAHQEYQKVIDDVDYGRPQHVQWSSQKFARVVQVIGVAANGVSFHMLYYSNLNRFGLQNKAALTSRIRRKWLLQLLARQRRTHPVATNGSQFLRGHNLFSTVLSS